MIKVMAIKSCEILDNKIMRVIHDKEINFIGNTEFMNEIQGWIKLVQAVNQNRASLKVEEA